MILHKLSLPSLARLAPAALAVALALLFLALAVVPVGAQPVTPKAASPETVIAPSPGANPANRKPAFPVASIHFMVAENTPAGQYVGPALAAQDPDDAALTYALAGADASAFDIDSGAGRLKVKAALDYETKTRYSLTVQVSDGKNDAGDPDPPPADVDDTLAVTISVTDVNEAPVAVADRVSTAVDTPVDISALDNDTDPDAGAVLAIRSVGFPNHGGVALNPQSGVITYTPPAGFRGHDSFIYTIDDGALTAQAAVTVAVAPVSAAPPESQPQRLSIPNPECPQIPPRLDANSECSTPPGIHPTPGPPGIPITGRHPNKPPLMKKDRSLSNVTYPENGQHAVGRYEAVDPEGDALFWSLGGTDAGSFNISSFGVLTFKTPPNYEKPADHLKDNVYHVTVAVSDRKNDYGLPDPEPDAFLPVTVTVIDDETDTADFTLNYAENGTGLVAPHIGVLLGQGGHDDSALLPRRPIRDGIENPLPIHTSSPIRWSLEGTDHRSFIINPNGDLAFRTPPDYEKPADHSANNIYIVTAVGRTPSKSASVTIAVTVTDVNEAPTVSGDAAVNYAENGAGPVATYAASDPDAGATHTWTLEGTDAGSFNISGGGVLTFKTPPDHEAKSAYSATVKATDNGRPGLSDTLAVTVTVTDVNEAPTVSGKAAVNYAENGAGPVATYAANDPDAGATHTWTLVGTGASDFNISGGVLTFKTPPDYETQSAYSVTVKTTDNGSPGLSGVLAVTVTVTDVNEAPTVSGNAAVDYAENGAGPVATYAASDPDAGATHTWTLEGTDASSFNISGGGVLTFKTPPDYEAKSSYSVMVKATDNGRPGLSGALAATVTVTNVNEAPVFSGEAALNMEENRTAAGTVAAADLDSGDDITGYAITGGADSARFAIGANSGALTFNTAPDYESPLDATSATPANAAGNNEYVVVVTATGGAGDRELTASQTIVVTVTDASEPPGKPAAPTVSDASATGLTMTWTAPANTGPPITDYDVQYRPDGSEIWTDPGHRGTATTTVISGLVAGTAYQVQVRAANDEGTGPWSDSRKVASVAATNPVETPVQNENQDQEQAANAPPAFSSGAAFRVVENRTAVGTVEAADPDSGDDITGYAITAGADAAKFAIGANSGALTFNTAPDYENPQDALSTTPANAAGNNEYVVVVTATAGADGQELTASQTIVVTVTNVNEPPVIHGNGKARYKVRYAENGTGEVATFSASDPESDAITWSLKTFDAKGFSISSSGVLTLKAPPDYENPADKNRNSVYKFNVQVSDGKAADGSTDHSVDAYLPVTVRVTDEDDGGDRAAMLPAQPSGFAATAGNGSVTLSWNNPNDDRITLYRYKYGVAGSDGQAHYGKWADIPNSGADTVSFTVTGLDNGTTYEFKVRAKNAAGRGPSSAIASATPSATP